MSQLGKVRPTTSKVLESLLATLEEVWPQARVLDLFAGNGTLGKAALERGAAAVVFVEGHPSVAARLRRWPQSQLVTGRLPGALARVEGRFEVVLADPPYGAPEGPECLERLEAYVEEAGWVVFEHHHKDPYPDRAGQLSLWKRRRFGETALSYYRKGPLPGPQLGKGPFQGPGTPSGGGQEAMTDHSGQGDGAT